MKRTAKQKVLAKFPDAYAYQWAGDYAWVIYADKPGGRMQHHGALNTAAATARQAWAEAAKRMRNGR